MALVVNALRLGERKRASVLLSSLVFKKECIKHETFSYILDFCARMPDPMFAMETWKYIEENKIKMDDKCWKYIIKALCRGDYFNEAYSLLSSLDEMDRVMIPLCNSFLSGCSRAGNLHLANKCLQFMESRLIGKSEITYRELLKLAVQQNNLSLVHKICKECRKYYEPNILSLEMFVWSLSKLGDLESAFGALKEIIALSMERFTCSEYSCGGRHASKRLDIPIPCKNDKQDSVNEEFPFPPIHGEEPFSFPFVAHTIRIRARRTLERSFNILIYACAKVRNCELAEQLFLQMHNLGLEPSASTYDGVVKAVISKRGVSYAAKLVEEMKSKNLKAYSSTIGALSIGYSKILELDTAEELLDQLADFSSRSVHPFNSLFAAYCSMDMPERGIRLLAKMKSLKIIPNAKTYELCFSLFGIVNAPYEEGNSYSQSEVAKRVRAIEMDMARNGVEHTLFTLENLIRALGSEGMVDDVLRYLNMAENKFSDAYPGTLTYNLVLHALVEAKKNRMAIQIFSKMRSLMVPLDAATYNIMIDWCSNLKLPFFAQSLVSLMIRDGFLPSACTCSTLMKVFLANEDFCEALTLLDQSLLLGFDVDVLFFNTVLEEACFKGHLDIVESVVERMHQEKIKPDPSTCSHVFSVYIDAGFHVTAMEALQVLSMRMISEDTSALQDAKAMYESLIYSEDPAVESWITDIFSKSDEHIGAALLNLRWSAISGADICWSPDESSWAQRLSARYGSLKLPA